MQYSVRPNEPVTRGDFFQLLHSVRKKRLDQKDLLLQNLKLPDDIWMSTSDNQDKLSVTGCSLGIVQNTNYLILKPSTVELD